MIAWLKRRLASKTKPLPMHTFDVAYRRFSEGRWWDDSFVIHADDFAEAARKAHAITEIDHPHILVSLTRQF